MVTYGLAYNKQNLSSFSLHAFSLILPCRVTKILIPLTKCLPLSYKRSIRERGVYLQMKSGLAEQ